MRHIAYCEVAEGKVVDRTAVKSLSQLASRLGPGTESAVVAFEAYREGWHVHDKLREWGHDPRMLDTTRVRQMGVGQHGRKNDPIDAEAIAMALDAGRIAEAHVLSPERRMLRAQLSVRGALVETRAQYVTTIRGLARAAGVLLPTCDTENFVRKLDGLAMDEATRALVAPRGWGRRSAGKWDALKLSNEPPRSSDAWRQTARASPPNLRRRGCCRSPTVPLLRCALRAR